MSNGGSTRALEAQGTQTLLQPARTQESRGPAGAGGGPLERLRQMQQGGGNQAVQEMSEELRRDIDTIKAELDSTFYTEGVEETVIGLLNKWVARGTMASGYLDSIFDALQARKGTIFGETTYYDAMLDDFDRVAEVRRLRDGTLRYRGRESAEQTEEAREEAAEQAETNVQSDLFGEGWAANVAESQRIPRTPENVALAELTVKRLASIPSERLSAQDAALSWQIGQFGVDVLFVDRHWVLATERAERRKAAMRAVVEPLLDLALWMTAEKLAALTAEAVLARLVESWASRATTSLALREAELVGTRALGRLAVRETEVAGGSALGGLAKGEGGALAGEGAVIAGEGYSYRVVRLDAKTGDLVAVGVDARTGEQAILQVNIDTGAGVATRTSTGETFAIRNGRLEAPPTMLGPGAGAAETALLPTAPQTPLLPETQVWVNTQSGIYHPPETHWFRVQEGAVARGPQWTKMPFSQAEALGHRAALPWGEAMRREGARRVEEFLADYATGGRLRNFGAAPNPAAVHQEVTLYIRDADGVLHLGTGLPGSGKEMGRRLDVVDLTNPKQPLVFEIGTATPSVSEVRRKAGQLDVWEDLVTEAGELTTGGVPGQVVGRLPSGEYVDLTGGTYFEVLWP